MIEIISIHIPKTAGTSFLTILNSVYEPDSIEHFISKNYTIEKALRIPKFISELTDNIKLIHGHFQYNDVKDLRIKNNSSVITWVRDPIERVISNYSFFKKRIEQESENTNINVRGRIQETLLEYAALENSRNRMSKFMAGLELENFYFIGITENFSDDIRVLAHMLKWNNFDIPHANDNSEFKSGLPKVSLAEKRIIADLNKDDIDLYSRVLEFRQKRKR